MWIFFTSLVLIAHMANQSQHIPHWGWTWSGVIFRPVLTVSWRCTSKEILSTIYDTDMLQNYIFIQRSRMKKVLCNFKIKSLKIWTQSRGNRRMNGSYKHHDFWYKWPLHLALQDEEVLWIDGWKKEVKRRQVRASAKTGRQQTSAVQILRWKWVCPPPPLLCALFVCLLALYPHSVYPQQIPLSARDLTSHSYQTSDDW